MRFGIRIEFRYDERKAYILVPPMTTDPYTVAHQRRQKVDSKIPVPTLQVAGGAPVMRTHGGRDPHIPPVPNQIAELIVSAAIAKDVVNLALCEVSVCLRVDSHVGCHQSSEGLVGCHPENSPRTTPGETFRSSCHSESAIEGHPPIEVPWHT